MTSKWRNVDAGPRQVKDFNRAASALRSEGQSQTELYGVIGGKEHRSTVIAMMGPVRAEVAALDEAIGVRYGYQVTKASVRAIIADFEAALAEAVKSRPVVDNRRTPEQDGELQAAQAAQAAEWQAKADAEAAILAQVMAKAPAGAKALIYAEYDVDESDLRTDYFNSRTTRTVAIGFRFSSREDFRALRAAAAQFPETAHMASEEALKAWGDANGIRVWFDLEHRDNYSMGGGNYLSDHGSDRSGTGWVIRSRNFPASSVSLTEDAIPERPATPEGGFYDQRGNWIPQGEPATVAAGSVTVSPSSLGREGVVEVRFAEKPDADVITGLKAHGFRWARGNRCWYGRDTAYAEALATA